MAPERGADERRRVFFALWPDAATAASLVRATRHLVGRSGGRPMATDRLHVTVAFLGELTAERLERAHGAAPISCGAFDMLFDTVGYWPQSRVLWFAPSVVPPEVGDLTQRLWAALEERGFAREPRLFRPHVTLARRARPVGDGEPVAAVPWHAAELALVESLPAGRNVLYATLARWPL
jgi:2'-5' RNA ligase